MSDYKTAKEEDGDKSNGEKYADYISEKIVHEDEYMNMDDYHTPLTDDELANG